MLTKKIMEGLEHAIEKNMVRDSLIGKLLHFMADNARVPTEEEYSLIAGESYSTSYSLAIRHLSGGDHCWMERWQRKIGPITQGGKMSNVWLFVTLKVLDRLNRPNDASADTDTDIDTGSNSDSQTESNCDSDYRSPDIHVCVCGERCDFVALSKIVLINLIFNLAIYLHVYQSEIAKCLYAIYSTIPSFPDSLGPVELGNETCLPENPFM